MTVYLNGALLQTIDRNSINFDDETTWQFSEITGSQYQFPQNPDDGGGLGPGKNYYWKIRPIMGSGNESSWSEIYQFEILGLTLIRLNLILLN